LSLKSNAARITVLLGMAFAVSIPAFAQAPPSAPAPSKPSSTVSAAATPSAEQILDTYVKALGGREAWKKLTSRESVGTIEIPAMNLSGTIDLREKAPDQVVANITINGAKFSQGFDGAVGWSDDPQNGLREQAGTELAETKRDADFYHPLDLRQLYSKFTVTGIEKVDERDAYIVVATPPEGEPDKMYFDVQTGLLLRIIGHHHSAEGVAEFTEDLSDYRETDGIKLPFTVHQAGGDSTFTIKFTKVHHNITIENSEFSKPAAP
jgi:zinc protease